MTINAFPYESYAAGSYQAASAYLAKTNAPQTALDWQLALKDPYSKIGQLYLAVLSQSQLEQEDWLDFQNYLAQVQWATNQQATNDSARQADARYERDREQRLQETLERQQQIATVSDQPFLTTGFAEALDKLILELMQLMKMKQLLIKQSATLDNQWYILNTRLANHLMNHLMANRHLLTAADRHILMQKTHQLTKALTPPSLTQLLTVNPRLTDLLYQAVKQPQASLIFDNIVKVNDMMSELNLHAQWADQAEPLMGGALLAA